MDFLTCCARRALTTARTASDQTEKGPQMSDDPKGVTAVLIDPQGRVVASASDFNRGGSAGISQREAQRYRVKTACAVDYVTAACNGYVAEAIRRGYPGAEGLMQKLVSDSGFRLHFIEHGYPTSDEKA